MDAAVAKTRLGRLKNLLLLPEFGGLSQERIAEALGLPNGSYLSRLLSGGKSLGERTARRIEKRRGLPPYWFDNVDGARIAEPARVYGQAISPDEANVGREWGKLREPMRGHFVRAIELAVADQKVRERRHSKRKTPEPPDDKHPTRT